MCGIIAALCKNPNICHSVLFSGLKYMQNRGYDSAGIFSINKENGHYKTILTKFASTEEKSALQLIEPHLSKHSNSFIGFGHTRWATHGAKTDINSHPHTSINGYFTIVHNGILENYCDLKTKSCCGPNKLPMSELQTSRLVQVDQRGEASLTRSIPYGMRPVREVSSTGSVMY